MSLVPPDELWPELEKLGEEAVRKRVAQQVYGPRKLPAVQAWLEEKDRERADARARTEAEGAADLLRSATGTKTATWVIAWATVALVLVTAAVWLLNR